MAHITTTSPATASLHHLDSMTTSPAHRLSELVQALTGCGIERAELAVCDPTPLGPSSAEDALTTMARAMVRLRARQPV